MRAYTITDVDDGEVAFVKEGVFITNGDGEPGLRVGDGDATTHVPVSREGVELFRAAKEIAQEEGKALHGMVLEATDIADNGLRLVKERTRRSPFALVHLAICAGHGGRMWLEDAGFDTCEEPEQVRRVPRAFPGHGIEVMAIGHGPQGEPHGLFRLKKGAAFRIRRNGALEGAPPVLDINWNGHQLYVRPSPQYRKK